MYRQIQEKLYWYSNYWFLELFYKTLERLMTNKSLTNQRDLRECGSYVGFVKRCPAKCTTKPFYNATDKRDYITFMACWLILFWKLKNLHILFTLMWLVNQEIPGIRTLVFACQVFSSTCIRQIMIEKYIKVLYLVMTSSKQTDSLVFLHGKKYFVRKLFLNRKCAKCFLVAQTTFFLQLGIYIF